MSVPVSAPAVPFDGMITAVEVRTIGASEREQLLSWLSAFVDPTLVTAVKLRWGGVVTYQRLVMDETGLPLIRRGSPVCQWFNAPVNTPLPPVAAWQAALTVQVEERS